jgi:hypothetical protein
MGNRLRGRRLDDCSLLPSVTNKRIFAMPCAAANRCPTTKALPSEPLTPPCIRRDRAHRKKGYRHKRQRISDYGVSKAAMSGKGIPNRSTSRGRHSQHRQAFELNLAICIQKQQSRYAIFIGSNRRCSFVLTGAPTFRCGYSDRRKQFGIHGHFCDRSAFSFDRVLH